MLPWSANAASTYSHVSPVLVFTAASTCSTYVFRALASGTWINCFPGSAMLPAPVKPAELDCKGAITCRSCSLSAILPAPVFTYGTMLACSVMHSAPFIPDVLVCNAASACFTCKFNLVQYASSTHLTSYPGLHSASPGLIWFACLQCCSTSLTRYPCLQCLQHLPHLLC